MRIIPISIFIVVLTLLTGCGAFNSVGKSFGDWTEKTLSSNDNYDKSKPPEASKINTVKNDPNCPEVKIVTDLGTITKFANKESIDIANQVETTRIDSVSAICKRSDKSVELEISINFLGTLGAMGIKDLNGQANYTYPYFLSVITPNGKILSKDVFALAVEHQSGNLVAYKQDKLRQIIPLTDGQEPNKFQVLIGFQLNADELSFNRNNKK